MKWLTKLLSFADKQGVIFIAGAEIKFYFRKLKWNNISFI